ncbi:MAG: tRNA pseudouridine(54/55) synthase Pus10 [Desulfurococcaceae archaeon]
MSEEDFVNILKDLIEKSERILSEYPLCNTCFGRLFAKCGIGLSNYARGSMLKTLLAMKLYFDRSKGMIGEDYLKRIAVNGGEALELMFRKTSGVEVAVNKCFICGNSLNSAFIDAITKNVCEELKGQKVSSFLIGVVVDKSILERELELVSKYGTSSAESIKREIKREVGKAVSNLCNVKPDFSDPEALVMVYLDGDLNHSIKVQISPMFLKGVYWKLARRISHVPWIEKAGGKKYPWSVQEAVEASLRDVFKCRGVVIHAAGREDVDARMIGTGRPLVIEIKSPKRRDVGIETINEHVAKSLLSYPVKVEITSLATRRDVAFLKEYSRGRKKVYRVCVYSSSNITPQDLMLLEKTFDNVEVSQRTPTRILRRKKDKERLRRVYKVRAFLLSNRVFEAIVQSDGGLYIKELVHCDSGRTAPCFAGVLEKKLVPVELDVLNVEK